MDYDIVTFDCYGTLIDWDSGITAAFARMIERDQMPYAATDLRRLYEEIEPVVEAEGYRTYREVLAESARRAAARIGWELMTERAAYLSESLPGWPPFADTNSALERLVGAGLRLGILSNVDDELLAATRRQFTVDFDLVVTAEQVGSYKPAHGHFLTARERIGPARWLHAAQSSFHDVVPARALGIVSAWINRRGEAPTGEARPDREFRDLTGLADWLAPR